MNLCLPLPLHNILTFETDLFYKDPSPLTRHINVSDGVQKTHVVVVVVLVEARVWDHLQCSVAFPQADVCNADRVHHHQPVPCIQHVVPAGHTAGLV